MALDLVQEFDVFTEFVKFKFGITPKTSSIKNEIFKVYVDSATPTLVSDPFLPIDLPNHYNSIGKILSIYWKPNKLIASTNYKIIITGLLDAAGNIIPDGTYHFSTGASVVQAAENLPPATVPVEIEDHSIKSDVFTDITTIVATNPDFYIVSVDPDNQDFDLPKDYNKGRIGIKFSTLPNGIFLNPTYFKVQKKAVQRAPSRWVNVTPHVVGDSGNSTVYLSLPSTDATPVFDVAGKTYFEPQYKYRIIVSKDVGV